MGAVTRRPATASDVETARLLAAIADAPLTEIAARLRDVIDPLIAHRALLIFTEDCTGRPQKKAGDPEITDRATIAELDAARRGDLADGRLGPVEIAGTSRPVRVWRAPTDAILLLVEPEDVSPDPALAAYMSAVWELTASRIREQVAAAAPAYLMESRAASQERVRVTAELTEQQVADLEDVLSVLRSSRVSDQQARAVATQIASAAIVHARTAGDLVISMTEEPVTRAFERLRRDMHPLTRFGDLEVEFVEPPADGRALPGEVAHAARAIVRNAILAMREQERVGRIRVQWDCDGTNLLVDLRDDGPGDLDADVAEMKHLALRARALDGTFWMTGTPGWGSELHVRLPLDLTPPADQVAEQWNLTEREVEVLRLIAGGRRNRQIASELAISENTVKFHVASLYRKLGVSNRASATALGLEARIR